MTTDTPDFAGWAQAGLPIVAGAAPLGALSLAALAEAATFQRQLPALATLAGGQRKAALTLAHYAVYAVASVLLAPLLIDGVALDSPPDQLGLILDEQGGLAALWVGQFTRVGAVQPAAHAAARALQLVNPIAEQARRAGKVSARGIANITIDALVASSRSCARSAGADADPLVAALIAAGPPWYQPPRPILAQPDAGPPVVFYVPRTCCVLCKQPSEHACPTCPQYPDDAARQQKIIAWLGAMGDDDFRAVTGRARVMHVQRTAIESNN